MSYIILFIACWGSPYMAINKKILNCYNIHSSLHFILHASECFLTLLSWFKL
jgi:hypothetical protein